MVDNASDDGSVSQVALRWPNVKVVRSSKNLGFAGGANLGARSSTGSVLVFLNPDMRASPPAVRRLAETLGEAPGVSGPAVMQRRQCSVEAGGVVDVAGMPRGLPRYSEQTALYMSGCCLATSRTCFDSVGGFDERYFMFVEDVEYCWQALRRGFALSILDDTLVEHTGGAVTPGGYRVPSASNIFEISAARILLRERNTTTMLLACVPLRSVPLAVCASLVRSSIFAAVLFRVGAPKAIGGILAGWLQLLVWLPGTIRRRLRPPICREASNRAWALVERSFFLAEHLRSGARVRLVGSLPKAAPRSWKAAVGSADRSTEVECGWRGRLRPKL